MSEAQKPRRRPLSRKRKLGSRRRRGRNSEPTEQESEALKKAPVEKVIDKRFSPELKAPYGTFAKLMVTLLLMILVQTLQAYLPTETSWTTSPQQEEMRRVVEPTLRLVEGPNANYLVSPPLSQGQESLTEFLLDKRGTGVTTITVTSTWPEYIGYSLWLCFGLSVLWFLFTLIRGEWTKTFRKDLRTWKVLALGSLFGAYAISAYLGWVWHDPIPFGLMYLTLLSFAALKDKIPVKGTDIGRT